MGIPGCFWDMAGAGDDLIALHTVNETPAGRLYVYLAIYLT